MIDPLDKLVMPRTALPRPKPSLSMREAAACFAASTNCHDAGLLASIVRPGIVYRSDWTEPTLEIHGKAKVVLYFRLKYQAKHDYRSQLITFQSDQQPGVLVKLNDEPGMAAVVRLFMQRGLVSGIEVTRDFQLSEVTLSGVFPPEG